MSMRPTAWLVAFAVLNAGCSLVSDGAHVISYRTRQALNDSRESHRNRRLADEAWKEAGGRTPGLSADFGDGYKEGFAAHLYRGTCEPPALPPARYRTVRNQTPEGYRAAEEWFNGFRQGVAEAQSRGLRELVTGPSAFRTTPPTEATPTPPVPVSSVPAPSPPMPTPLPSPAPLPPPMHKPVAPPVASGPAPTVRAVVAAPPPVSSPETPPQSRPAPRVVAVPEVVPAAVVSAVVAPPPIRLTMQQLVRARLVVVVPANDSLTSRPSDPPAKPEPTPPPAPPVSNESAPNWTSSRSSDADGPAVIWWRADGPDVRATAADRIRIGMRGTGMSRAGSTFAGGP